MSTKKSKRVNPITYSKNRDLRSFYPNLHDYMDPRWSAQDIENYLNICRHNAYVWVNNQIEAFELQTYALDNDKKLTEANYALYLVLRGAAKRAQSDLVNSFKMEAEQTLASVLDRRTNRKNLSSQVSRMTRSRTKLKDYGHLNEQ